MIENVSTQLTVFHCFAHCLLPGRAFASLYALLFLEKEAEIGGRVDGKDGQKCIHMNEHTDKLKVITIYPSTYGDITTILNCTPLSKLSFLELLVSGIPCCWSAEENRSTIFPHQSIDRHQQQIKLSSLPTSQVKY